MWNVSVTSTGLPHQSVYYSWRKMLQQPEFRKLPKTVHAWDCIKWSATTGFHWIFYKKRYTKTSYNVHKWWT